MDKEPKVLVSIIVPIYKSVDYMEQCVDSLIAQTYTNTEIILVDDGSPDDSGTLADRLCEKDARIKVIHKENGGTASACNAGLDVAKGEYITIMDADDWVHPDMVRRLLDMCLKHDARMSMGELQEVYTRETPPTNMTNRVEILPQREAVKELIQDKKVRSFYQAKLMKAELFQETRFTEGMSYEDVAIFQDLLLQVDELVYTPDVFCYYYQHDGSILHSRDLQLSIDQLVAFQIQMDHILEAYPEYRNMLELRQFKYELSTYCYYLAEYREDIRYTETMKKMWKSLQGRYLWLRGQKGQLIIADRIRYLRCKWRR